jgi:hypothetical protein
VPFLLNDVTVYERPQHDQLRELHSSEASAEILLGALTENGLVRIHSHEPRVSESRRQHQVFRIKVNSCWEAGPICHFDEHDSFLASEDVPDKGFYALPSLSIRSTCSRKSTGVLTRISCYAVWRISVVGCGPLWGQDRGQTSSTNHDSRGEAGWGSESGQDAMGEALERIPPFILRMYSALRNNQCSSRRLRGNRTQYNRWGQHKQCRQERENTGPYPPLLAPYNL